MKLLRAILAHLYIAWIHPFGDGNGRVARLVEFQLLAEAGMATPACHLLSNHDNRTKQMYYRRLAETSREPYPVQEFVAYALDGLVEQLRGQLEKIRRHQLGVAWVNFVHEMLHDKSPERRPRLRALVLSLSHDRHVPVADLRTLTPELIDRYRAKQVKTVTRDVNELAAMNLIEHTNAGIRARVELMAAFLPIRQGLVAR